MCIDSSRRVYVNQTSNSHHIASHRIESCNIASLNIASNSLKPTTLGNVIVCHVLSCHIASNRVLPCHVMSSFSLITSSLIQSYSLFLKATIIPLSHTSRTLIPIPSPLSAHYSAYSLLSFSAMMKTFILLSSCHLLGCRLLFAQLHQSHRPSACHIVSGTLILITQTNARPLFP